MLKDRKTVWANKKKTWTEKDEDFLLTYYGINNVRYLMSQLKRSKSSIQQKHRDLTGFKDVKEAGGALSTGQIAFLLGVDTATVRYWIQNFKLKSKFLHRVSASDKSGQHYVDPHVFWNWLERNKERANFSRVQRGYILPEPEWLDEEIKKATPRKRSVNWTEEEDELAFSLWQSGVNYREIASRISRPERGVQRRLTVIRKNKEIKHSKTK